MLTHFLVKTVYIYLIGFFLAILEIQIEGEHGWAAKLPTWRAKPGSWLDRVYKKIMTNKDLTGYHTVLMIFLFLFFHLPFVWFWQWSIWSELEILSFLVLLSVVWDFLWFVLNPAFSLHTFGPKKVWWHKKWWGKFPTDYYSGLLVSLLLILPEALKFGAVGWYKIIILFGVNLILTVITVKIYPKAY
jgi:hypothetical protein